MLTELQMQRDDTTLTHPNMAPSAGDPKNLTICERVDTRCPGVVAQRKISLLFRLQVAGKEAKRFQDLCSIKPLTEQIPLTSV